MSELQGGYAVIPIWLLRSESVSHHAKAVYLHLSSRVGREGVCWPSQMLLAKEAGMSERQVRRALVELRALGVIEIKVETHATGRRNRYRLLADRYGGAATRS